MASKVAIIIYSMCGHIAQMAEAEKAGDGSRQPSALEKEIAKIQGQTATPESKVAEVKDSPASSGSELAKPPSHKARPYKRRQEEDDTGFCGITGCIIS
ncbi:hypothetical protein V1524DRAFT_412196 [Lipomyces starkeyi]